MEGMEGCLDGYVTKEWQKEIKKETIKREKANAEDVITGTDTKG